MDESAHLFPGMNSELYIAAEQGNVVKLNKILEAKLNIFKEFTALQNSALHIAVSRGNLLFIERLLQEVNKDLVAGREFLRAKNSHGNSALHLAAFHGHHELVENLLYLMEGDVEDGNFLRVQNREGNTALHEAAKGENYKVVEVLLKHSRHQNLTSESNREGETAVFIASQRGHTDIVKRLLPFMDFNSKMKRHDGQTPLHSAVFYGHTGVAKHLLQLRPDLGKEIDGCGRTVMHMLVLSSPVPGFVGLDLTCGRNSIKIAGLLLRTDNSLCYKQDNKRQTPLHMAVERAKYDLVRILLRYGRDCIEVVDKDGRKPLHLAVINAVRLTRTPHMGELYQFKNMLLSLMSRESLNHHDNTGRTALHIAVENIEKDVPLYQSIIKVLQTHGALLTPEILEDTRRMDLSPPKLWVNAENLSINAVLIATVSFAAAFTLPGGLVSQAGAKPRAVFIDALLFKLFVICNTFSFCTSIASAILVQYTGAGEQQELSQVVVSVRLLGLALLSLVVAFGAALHMVITPSAWLVEIVWTMVSLVPLTIYVVRFNSKHFIFMPDRYNIWIALAIPFGAIFTIFLIIWDIFNVFLFAGLFSNVAHWIKKLLKPRRQWNGLIFNEVLEQERH